MDARRSDALRSDALRSDALRSDLQATIQRDGVLSFNDNIVVGVSGGVDSMVLLDLLRGLREEMGWAVFACHLDHGLREDAKRDVALVSTYCKEHTIPLIVESVNIEDVAKKMDTSVENAGRRTRRALYERVAQENNARVVCLAHHMEDQAETVLLHLFRGSGLQGLTGMQRLGGLSSRSQGAKAISIYRPLLAVSKQDLYRFAEAENIPYREDETNQNDTYLRNRIRNELIPWIQTAINPNVNESLAKLAMRLQEDAAFLDDATDQCMRDGKIREEGSALYIDKAWYTSQAGAIQVRILQHCIANLRGSTRDFTNEDFDRIAHVFSLDTGKRVTVCDMIFTSFYDALRMERKIPTDENLEVSETCESRSDPIDFDLQAVDHNGTVDRNVSSFDLHISYSLVTREQMRTNPPNENIIYCDRDLLHTLQLRAPMATDRFTSMGAKGGKPLRRAFTDWKVEEPRRATWPLLVDGEKIVWVIGLRRGAHAPVTSATTRILRVEWGSL